MQQMFRMFEMFEMFEMWCQAPLLGEGGELVGLVFVDERLDDLVEAAFEDIVEFVEGQVDTVVGDSSLWKIVGAYAFRAIARADEKLPLLGLLRLLFRDLCVEEPRLQQ